jgi:hypothetical protein
MYLAVPKAIFGQLQHHATLMGISESELAADLLKTIVQDDLCEAVLDRDSTIYDEDGLRLASTQPMPTPARAFEEARKMS